MSLEAIFSIINVTGDERPATYREDEFMPNSNEFLENGERNPDYDPLQVWGAVLSYTQPRRYEVGVRLEF